MHSNKQKKSQTNYMKSETGKKRYIERVSEREEEVVRGESRGFGKCVRLQRYCIIIYQHMHKNRTQ